MLEQKDIERIGGLEVHLPTLFTHLPLSYRITTMKLHSLKENFVPMLGHLVSNSI